MSKYEERKSEKYKEAQKPKQKETRKKTKQKLTSKKEWKVKSPHNQATKTRHKLMEKLLNLKMFPIPFVVTLAKILILMQKGWFRLLSIRRGFCAGKSYGYCHLEYINKPKIIKRKEDREKYKKGDVALWIEVSNREVPIEWPMRFQMTLKV